MVFELTLLSVAPPLLLGVIARVKAWFAGRTGPPLFQVYYDLIKLARKGMVVSRTASCGFTLAPLVVVVAILCAGLLFPVRGPAPIHFEGDLILFGYLLALARCAMLLAAWDVGSSFTAMGASREAAFGALAELAFFLGLVVLAVATHSLSLSGIFSHLAGRPELRAVLLLLGATFFVTTLAENARIPVDDPATHLELTMIHEAMLLDHSGPGLGLMLYGAACKLWLGLLFTAALLAPAAAPLSAGGVGWLLGKVLLLTIGIGCIESANARLRLLKVPQLLVANFVVTAFALLLMLSRGGH